MMMMTMMRTTALILSGLPKATLEANGGLEVGPLSCRVLPFTEIHKETAALKGNAPLLSIETSLNDEKQPLPME